MRPGPNPNEDAPLPRHLLLRRREVRHARLRIHLHPGDHLRQLVDLRSLVRGQDRLGERRQRAERDQQLLPHEVIPEHAHRRGHWAHPRPLPLPPRGGHIGLLGDARHGRERRGVDHVEQEDDGEDRPLQFVRVDVVPYIEPQPRYDEDVQLRQQRENEERARLPKVQRRPRAILPAIPPKTADANDLVGGEVNGRDELEGGNRVMKRRLRSALEEEVEEGHEELEGC
mmetsp:Transcript_14956/g.25559  ORF Transcript_14956/g.25559 Transcript_14956/m.25559 type:complete len:228 (-) Transcript_14956:254-937(-)